MDLVENLKMIYLPERRVGKRLNACLAGELTTFELTFRCSHFYCHYAFDRNTPLYSESFAIAEEELGNPACIDHMRRHVLRQAQEVWGDRSGLLIFLPWDVDKVNRVRQYPFHVHRFDVDFELPLFRAIYKIEIIEEWVEDASVEHWGDRNARILSEIGIIDAGDKKPPMRPGIAYKKMLKLSQCTATGTVWSTIDEIPLELIDRR